MSFVDTNVLVYAAARGAPLRDRARAALAGMAAGEPLSLSRQILRECIAAMTRQQTWGQPLALALATAAAAAFVQRFVIFEDGPSVWDQFIQLSRTYSFGVAKFMTPTLLRRC